MHDKRHDPGNGDLKREYGHGIARAQLALDSADCPPHKAGTAT